jgi:hypothetical protein
VRIERRKIESPGELTQMVTEVVEAEIKGIKIIDQVDLSDQEIEIGIFAGSSDGRLIVVMAKEEKGDGLVLSYGRHLDWISSNRERITRDHPDLDVSDDPGIVMLADGFSRPALTVIAMLAVEPTICFSMKCLGVGSQKGLYVEPIDVPKRERAAAGVSGPPQASLLTRAIDSMAGVADDLSVSASFGYVSESLDWVPVANLRNRRGTLWIESGPGKWTTKRIEDDESLGAALDKVQESYREVIRTKGGAKDLPEQELSEAERKSLRWE